MSLKSIKLLVALISFMSPLVQAQEEPPEFTVDGLQRVNDSQVDLLYALPGTDLSRYQRIFLLAPEVRFVEDYKRKVNQMYSNRVTDGDIQKIRTDLMQLFAEEFASELQDAGGYELVTEFGDDVLVVRPAIVDLDVVAPEAAARPNSRSLVRSVGRMTLYIELADSVSGATLVKAMDYQYDRTPVQSHLRNETRNEQAARKILGHWASLLRHALDEAKQRAISGSD